MATQLSIVNDVLRRLRENTVNSVVDGEYSQLIAMFLNQAKQECESRWLWSVYETEVETSIVSGTTTYDLSADTNNRSWLIRRHDDRVPLAFDVTSSGNKHQLYDGPLKDARAWLAIQSSTATSKYPKYFALTSNSAADGYSLLLLEEPTEARTWKTYWYVPQDDLAIDGTDDSTTLQIPYWPLYLYTLMYALNERGEEMGEPGNVAERNAINALGEAIENDMQVFKPHWHDLVVTNFEMLRNHMYGNGGIG